MRRHLLTSVLLILIAILTPSPGEAQDSIRLIGLELQHDGAAGFPGHRVNVRGCVFAGTDGARLEVRAIQFQGDGPAVPVKSNDPQRADADGNVLVRVDLKDLPKSGRFEQHVDIPYAALRLPLGNRQLVYEVACFVGDQHVSTQATCILGIEITKEGRTRQTVTVKVPRESDQVAWSFSADGTPREVRYASRKEVPVSEVRELATPIANGFHSQGFLAPPPLAAGDEAKIWFATTRKIVKPTATDGSRFGGEDGGGLTTGSCLVQIPRFHRRGDQEKKGWFANSKDYFHITTLQGVGREQWTDILKESLKEEDVLVYIHGFANSFDSAAHTAAQIGVDTAFRGRLVLLSWGSRGVVGLDAYRTDELASKKAVPHFSELLRTALEAARSQKGKIHIVAHSMGCRVATEMLQRLEQMGVPQGAIGHVVLAAPDVDVEEFPARYRSMRALARRTTLYYSPADFALLASMQVNTRGRLGLGPYLLSQDDLDNVDAEKVGTTALQIGHDYYNRKDELLIDLQMILQSNKSPGQRETLFPEPKIIEGVKCWWFP